MAGVPPDHSRGPPGEPADVEPGGDGIMPGRATRRHEDRTEAPNNGTPAPLHTLLKLNRHTAAPLYQQIDEQLTRLIAEGCVPPGAALPAERQLAQQLGLSRGTIQQ